MHGLRMFDTASIKKLYDQRYAHFREDDERMVSQIEQQPTAGWMTCREAVNLVKKMSKIELGYKL